MTRSRLVAAAPNMPERHLEKTRFFGDHVHPTCRFPGYAGSGWWAGVPREGAGAK